MALSLPPYSLCFPKKTKEEEEEDRRAYQKYDTAVSTLPRSTQPPHMHLSLYKGFWFPNGASFGLRVLQGTMAARDHFASRPDDILLATLPKVGTTWLKALAFATLNRNRNRHGPFPQSLLLSLNPHQCVPFLEYQLYSDGRIPNMGMYPSPRLLATHIPYSLLPPSVLDPGSQCRIVYLCRNPRDTFTSMWRFVCSLVPGTDETVQSVPGTGAHPLEEGLEAFLQGVYTSGPYWDHVLEYWRASREDPERVLFLKFEELKADPGAQLRRLAGFMGCGFSAEEEEEVEEVLRLCSLENLKGLEVNRTEATLFWRVGFDNRSFFRKGEVGDWKNHLTPEMAERLDKVTADKFRGTGLFF